MLCWLRWRKAGGGTSNRRLTVSIAAGLLFRQGVPPHATYLFKHALVQDAAYGTLLREPDARFMPASPKHSKASSRRSPRTSPNFWRVTAPRLD